jgi:YidC/Oxa1 family membrane protein insertase
MNIPGVSFPIFTVILVLFCMIADLFLQQVLQVKNTVTRGLFIIGGFFIIQHFLYPPHQKTQQEASKQIEEQVVVPVSNFSYLTSYLDVQCTTQRSVLEDTVLATDWGSIRFSRWDATISSLELSCIGLRKLKNPLKAVLKDAAITPGFLVSVGNQIPTNYQLIDRTDMQDALILEYQASIPDGFVYKKFIVDKNKYHIELEVRLEHNNIPECGVPVTIFFPAPVLESTLNELKNSDGMNVASIDNLSGILISSDNKFEKIIRDKAGFPHVWSHPALFGMDTRYFVYALLKDKSQFVEHASYLLNDMSGMTAVLQGTAKKSNSTWPLSFYLGPKETKSLTSVDQRLDKTLNYWWPVAALSRFLLNMLNVLYCFVHNYGWAIIILTFIYNLFLLPFTVESTRDIKKREEATKEYNKKMIYIRQKYKNDSEGFRREQTALIRENGFNIGKVFGSILQPIVFLTCNRLFSNAIELHGASWLWINDLSVSDPYYLLPLLVTVFSIIRLAQVMPKAEKGQAATGLLVKIAGGLLMGGFMVYISAGTVLGVLTNSLSAILLTPLIKEIKNSIQK